MPRGRPWSQCFYRNAANVGGSGDGWLQMEGQGGQLRSPLMDRSISDRGGGGGSCLMHGPRPVPLAALPPLRPGRKIPLMYRATPGPQL